MDESGLAEEQQSYGWPDWLCIFLSILITALALAIYEWSNAERFVLALVGA